MQNNEFNGMIIGKKEIQLLFVGDIIVCTQKKYKRTHVKPLRMKVLEKVIGNQINLQIGL